MASAIARRPGGERHRRSRNADHGQSDAEAEVDRPTAADVDRDEHERAREEGKRAVRRPTSEDGFGARALEAVLARWSAYWRACPPRVRPLVFIAVDIGSGRSVDFGFGIRLAVISISAATVSFTAGVVIAARHPHLHGVDQPRVLVGPARRGAGRTRDRPAPRGAGAGAHRHPRPGRRRRVRLARPTATATGDAAKRDPRRRPDRGAHDHR